ncbi:flagellar hook-associated protein 2 [Desulforamulus hydrothermalis]|uniref:Flagellar hook-associated protein 2 n=1 Tax=Desulforamulus hydrothermalis Lam5 = DSM 18033 TaxID=1121428 RepID=K8EBT5_9FIRM|nr:flagellar hook-associated protein 2 [Desulforamulus hydrothermalis]CCO09153.1 Putative filament-capping protein FliD [Desulforamulus hydrothermalis Lam5 = DSM 18033]SHH11593.1 flagellar hook-associated protein 2 [Desulforamulus hydrothermalis Lam5 = DSM 18033]
MGSNLRIGGLATGLDIDQMVSDLMKVQRLKVDKIKQKKQIAEWQREDYRDINNSLRALRDNVFTMKLQGTYLVKKAASSNESIVKATATSAAVPGNYTLQVTALASAATMNSTAEVAFNKEAATLKEQLGLTGSGAFKFTVNGSQEIEINPDSDTIDSLVAKINGAKLPDGKTGAGVTAFFDKTVNRMFVFSNRTGAEQKINFTAVDGFADQVYELLGDKLKLDSDGDPANGIDEAGGTNASFVFNGTTITGQSANQFTLAGINFNLTGASPGETVNITVAHDTEAVFNAVKSFVDLYNSTLEKINTKLSEEKYKDYLPLTDDQREQLSDEQEKKWEEKAKSGLLKNDTVLSGIVSKLRNAVSTSVSGVSNSNYDTLAEIGIKTLSYTEKGKLYLDESKLKEAITANPEAVLQLFTNNSDTYSNKGLAVRLYDELTAAINTITNKAGAASGYSLVDNSVLGKQISSLDKEIDTWEDRLEEIEDRYWKKFTALETAINKMNSQSAWLAQQFGSGN